MRQTIRELEVNMAYRWYISYGLYEKAPHFSTYGMNYIRRFKESGLAKEIFNKVLQQAVANGFVHPEQVYIDATHIKANANKKNTQKKKST